MEAFGAVVAIVEHHAVDRSAARRFRNQVETAHLDDPFGFDHLIGDVIAVDLDVFAVDGHILEVGEHRSAFLFREAAADAGEHVQRTIGRLTPTSRSCSRPCAIADRFGEADDGGVERVPRLDLEDARGFAADDQALGVFLQTH